MAKFYEYYKGEVTERDLREKSEIFVSEISSGIYVVEKDRFGDFSRDSFISASTLSTYFNNREKVVIERLDGFWVSNYNFLLGGK